MYHSGILLTTSCWAGPRLLAHELLLTVQTASINTPKTYAAVAIDGKQSKVPISKGMSTSSKEAHRHVEEVQGTRIRHQSPRYADISNSSRSATKYPRYEEIPPTYCRCFTKNTQEVIRSFYAPYEATAQVYQKWRSAREKGVPKERYKPRCRI